MKIAAASLLVLLGTAASVVALDNLQLDRQSLTKQTSVGTASSFREMKNKSSKAGDDSRARASASFLAAASTEGKEHAKNSPPPSLPPTNLPSPVPTAKPHPTPVANDSTESNYAVSTSSHTSSKTMKSMSTDHAGMASVSSKSEKKKSSGKKSGGNSEFLPVCVVDDRGFALAKTDPQFADGTTVFTSFNLVEADNSLTDAFNTVSAISGIVSALLAGGAALAIANPALAAGLGVAAAVFAVVGIIFQLLGSIFADLSDGEVMILNRLTEIINEIRVLRRESQIVLATLRRDIGDQTLDEIANVIDRISSSYEDFVDVAQLNSTTFNGTQEELSRIQESYRESFRYVLLYFDGRVLGKRDVLKLMCPLSEQYFMQ